MNRQSSRGSGGALGWAGDGVGAHPSRGEGSSASDPSRSLPPAPGGCAGRRPPPAATCSWRPRSTGSRSGPSGRQLGPRGGQTWGGVSQGKRGVPKPSSPWCPSTLLSYHQIFSSGFVTSKNGMCGWFLSPYSLPLYELSHSHLFNNWYLPFCYPHPRQSSKYGLSHLAF